MKKYLILIFAALIALGFDASAQIQSLKRNPTTKPHHIKPTKPKPDRPKPVKPTPEATLEPETEPEELIMDGPYILPSVRERIQEEEQIQRPYQVIYEDDVVSEWNENQFNPLNIPFEGFSNCELDDDARVILDNVVPEILAQPAATFILTGICDTRVGTYEDNQNIAWRRVEAVKNYLRMAGVPSGMLETNLAPSEPGLSGVTIQKKR